MTSVVRRTCLAIGLAGLAGACGGYGSSDADPPDAVIDAPPALAPEIDATFATNGRAMIEETPYTHLRDIDITADGKVLVTGMGAGPDSWVLACRFTTAGALDASWAGDGCLVGPSDTYAIGAVVSDAGVVIAGGKDTTPTLFRYTSAGVLDDTYGTDGSVALASPATSIYGIVADGSGVAVATYATDRMVGVARVDSGGTVIDTGASTVNGVATNLVRRSDGRFVVGINDDTVRSRIVDVTAELDTFSSRTVNDGIRQVLLQPDGKLLRLSHDQIARELPDGSPDTTFGRYSGGVAGVLDGQAQLSSMALLPDGRIAIVGSSAASSSVPQGALWLYTATGQPDTSFGTQGRVIWPSPRLPNGWPAPERLVTVAVAPDGSLFVAGGHHATAPQWGFVSRVLPP